MAFYICAVVQDAELVKDNDTVTDINVGKCTTMTSGKKVVGGKRSSEISNMAENKH